MTELVAIEVTGISATGYHGVFEFERREGQIFSVDVRIEAEVDTQSDELSDTVHYGQVAEAVHAHIVGEPLNLLETLAAKIADECLAFSGVRTVEVRVHKPEAPISVPFNDVTVTVTRRKQ